GGERGVSRSLDGVLQLLLRVGAGNDGARVLHRPDRHLAGQEFVGAAAGHAEGVAGGTRDPQRRLHAVIGGRGWRPHRGPGGCASMVPLAVATSTSKQMLPSGNHSGCSAASCSTCEKPASAPSLSL